MNMAEPISIQQLKDASEDAISLAEFINKPENVMIPRRLASDINSLQYYLEYMKSFAQRSYESYDEMVANASNLSDNVSVFVTNDSDTSKNGIYTYNGADFIRGEYQPENAAKEFVEAKLKILPPFDNKTLADNFIIVSTNSPAKVIRNQKSINDARFVTPEDYGAIGDGAVHTLNEWIPSRFADLTAIKAVFPFVTSLSQTIDYVAIQAALNTEYIVELKENAHYVIGTLLNGFNTIRGNNAQLDNSFLTTERGKKAMLTYNNIARLNAVNVKGIVFKSNYVKTAGSGSSDSGVPEWGHHISLISCKRFNITDNTFDSPIGDGVYLGSSNSPYPNKDITIKRNKILNARRCGVALVSVDGAIVERNFIQNNGYVAAVDLEPNPVPDDVVTNVTVRFNTIESKTVGVFLTDPRDNKLCENTRIEDNIISAPVSIKLSHTGYYKNLYIRRNTMSNPIPAKFAWGMSLAAQVFGELVVEGNTDTTLSEGWDIALTSTVSAKIERNIINRPTDTSINTISRGMIIQGNATDVRIYRNEITLVGSGGGGINIASTVTGWVVEKNIIKARIGIDTRGGEIFGGKVLGNTFDCELAAWVGFAGKSDIYFDDKNITVGSTVLMNRTNQLKDVSTIKGYGADKRIAYGASLADITGNGVIYGKGSILHNTNPAAGGYAGWICTTAGLTGTTAVWKGFGLIEANTP